MTGEVELIIYDGVFVFKSDPLYKRDHWD